MPWAQAGAPGTSSYLTHRQVGRPVPVPIGEAVLLERFTPRAAWRLKGQALGGSTVGTHRLWRSDGAEANPAHVNAEAMIPLPQPFYTHQSQVNLTAWQLATAWAYYSVGPALLHTSQSMISGGQCELLTVSFPLPGTELLLIGTCWGWMAEPFLCRSRVPHLSASEWPLWNGVRRWCL